MKNLRIISKKTSENHVNALAESGKSADVETSQPLWDISRASHMILVEHYVLDNVNQALTNVEYVAE